MQNVFSEIPSSLDAKIYFCRTLDIDSLGVYTLDKREEQKMKNKKLTTEQATKVFESFNRSFYWLQVLVNTGSICEAQAGYIISKGGYNV